MINFIRWLLSFARGYNTNQLPSGKIDDDVVDADGVYTVSEPSDFIGLAVVLLFIGLIVLIVPFLKDAGLIVVSFFYCLFGGC